MNIVVDRTSPHPLHQQIVAAILDHIHRGALAPGRRLPSSRDLAQRLGVNRATVVQSYRELGEQGWLESGVGRGTFVSRQGVTGCEPLPPRSWQDRLVALHGGPAATTQAAGDAGLTRLSHAVAHPSLFPTALLREAFEKALDRHGAGLFSYSAPAGLEPLREQLRARLSRRGIDFDRNELLVVNGSQQGLDLVARLLLHGGGTVLTSRPAFSGALSAFRVTGSAAVGVGLDGDGIDPGELESAVRSHKPSLVYLIPYCHNPTGVTLSEERCQQVLQIARRHDVPVLEDDWLGELPGARPACLKSRDDAGQVLYLGTLSKVLVPGLRIGWLVVPREVFPAALALKKTTDLACNLPGQAVACQLLEDGSFDRHVQQVAAALERRRTRVEAAIERSFPAAARPLRPHRGMVLWVQLPAHLSPRQLIEDARREGVDIADGAAFDPAGRSLPGFRISYATAPEEELAPAIEVLGRLLTGMLAGTPAAFGPALV